jgi:predicted metal-binding protein
MLDMVTAATLYVCTTCKGVGDFDPEAERPGARLHLALTKAATPAGVTIKGVECLSACNSGCSVALSAPGKWTYVYGRLDPALHVPEILAGVALYAESSDGVVPWRLRPEVFRKQSLARVPPMETTDV